MPSNTSTDSRTDAAGSAESADDSAMAAFWAAARLVAEREIRTFVRMRGFWIGFGTIVVAVFAMAILPSVFGGGPNTVAVVGDRASTVLEATDMELVDAENAAEAGQLVMSEEVDAAVVPDTTGQSATGLRIVALSEPPGEIVAALGTVPPVSLLDAPDVDQGARTLIIMMFGLLFLMFGMGGVAIAQSTVTEKQTRIVEILVATVPIRALLAGKILGHALLTIGQVVALAVLAPIALRLGGHSDLLGVVAPAVAWFVPFMCLGFVLLAALWAVAGSVVSRQEDLGSSMGLVMTLVMVPYFGVLFFSDNPVVMTVLSYVPFSAPVAMPVRLFSDSAAVWEALASLGLLACAGAGIVLLASRIYSGSLLQMRGKVALSRAWARAAD